HIGRSTRAGWFRFGQRRGPYCCSVDSMSAGNGALMRPTPVPLFFAATPQGAIEGSGDSSRTTHGATAAVDACRYFGGLIVGAVSGATKDELLSPRYCAVPNYWEQSPLT